MSLLDLPPDVIGSELIVGAPWTSRQTCRTFRTQVDASRTRLLLRAPLSDDVGPFGRMLARLPRLVEVECHGTWESLLPLTACNRLSRLSFAGACIRDGEFTWLSNARGISDVGPLASCTQLTRLDLRGTGVSDVGPLAACTQLTSLTLSGCTGISDVGPLFTPQGGVQACTQLKSLDLGRCTGLSDVGPLAACKQLTSLDLSWCTGISDVGPLAACTQLTKLDLSGCTDVAIATWPLHRPLYRSLYGF